jgi:hypothetical protein
MQASQDVINKGRNKKSFSRTVDPCFSSIFIIQRTLKNIPGINSNPINVIPDANMNNSGDCSILELFDWEIPSVNKIIDNIKSMITEIDNNKRTSSTIGKRKLLPGFSEFMAHQL